MLLLSLSLWAYLSVTGKYYTDLTRLNDSIPEEVAMKGVLDLEIPPSMERWKKCVPRESKPYSSAAILSESEKIFSGKELKDLMACETNSCAFNFLSRETTELKNAKNDASIKKALFFKFVEDRVKGISIPDPSKSSQFYRSSEKLWEICGEEARWKEILDHRMNKKVGNFRFSVVQYKSNMRPTVRLLQGAHFDGKVQPNHPLCFGEALGFATHYDIDRAELWSWEPVGKGSSKLILQIRHRIDLLNSWARRLSKPSFVKQLEQITEDNISEAAKCLESK